MAEINMEEIAELYFSTGIHEGIEELLTNDPSYLALTDIQLRLFFAVAVENFLDIINGLIYVDEKKTEKIIEGKVVPEPRASKDLGFSTVKVGD